MLVGGSMLVSSNTLYGNFNCNMYPQHVGGSTCSQTPIIKESKNTATYINPQELFFWTTLVPKSGSKVLN